MSFKRTIPWTRQPQYPVGVDYGNPLLTGAAFLWQPNDPRNVISGTLKTTDKTTLGVAQVGRVINCSVSQVNLEWAKQFIKTSDGVGTGDFSLLVIANPATAGNGAVEHVLVQKNDAGGTPFAQAGFYAHSNDIFGYSSGAVAFNTYNGTGVGLFVAGQCDGKYHIWLCTRSGSTLTIYKDGVSVGSSTAAAQNILQSAERYTAIGSRGNGTTEGYRNQVAGAAGWNRALKANEAALIKTPEHFWQLFKPLQRNIYVQASGAGSSGTVAYTNANDTVAASGTTTVTGTLAKTNANDSVSASGTTTVTGTLAATNANDSVSASGSTGAATGTVAYTNANDTVVATGSTTARGSGYYRKIKARIPIRVYDLPQKFESLQQLFYRDADVNAEKELNNVHEVREQISKIDVLEKNMRALEMAQSRLSDIETWLLMKIVGRDNLNKETEMKRLAEFEEESLIILLVA